MAFAICIYPFHPSGEGDLPLQIGDELYIFEQGGVDGAWYRGYLIAPPSLIAGLTSSKGRALEARVFRGIFPRDCVEIRELLGEVARVQDEGGADARNGSVHGNQQQVNGMLAERSPDGDGEVLLGQFPRPPIQASARGDRGYSNRTESSGTSPTQYRHGAHEGPHSPEPIQKPEAPLPLLKIGDESVSSKEEPLIDEIASCLREWHSTSLHELLLNRQYDLLDSMSAIVTRLDSARRQLLHKILTKQELRVLRENAVWDLVQGSKLLSGDVIVRDPENKGRIMTSNDSAIDISRLQTMMSLLPERPTSKPELGALYHLFVDLKNYQIGHSKPTTFGISLYTKPDGGSVKLLSESFSLDATSSTAPSGQLSRTLFTDLIASEIGKGANDRTRLYLVIKVFTDEPLQGVRTVGKDNPAIKNGDHQAMGNTTTAQGPASKGSRRSLMWGSRGRKDVDSQSRPATSMSSYAVMDNRAVTPEPFGDKGQKPARRLTGIGVLEVSGLVVGQDEVDRSVTIWMPAIGVTQSHEQDHDWNDVVQEVAPNPVSWSRSSVITGVVIQLKAFHHPQSEELVQSTPTLLHNIQSTRRIGFADAPTKPRSDIYVTLVAPLLPSNALLSHPRGGAPISSAVNMNNLQLTLETRDSSYERVSHAIFPSSNSIGHTGWRTTAIRRGEKWEQTVRLSIKPDDVPGSHLVMSISNGGDEFPFALAYMPLWTDKAFARDGEHTLLFYKYDEHTAGKVAGKGLYLTLPWENKIKDEAVTGPIAGMRIRTYLCSTRFSQDPQLLMLLKWRDLREAEIVRLFTRFSFVPEMEIVKLLDEVLGALFEILVEYSGREEIEDLVFSSLVTVLDIVHDRRFNLQPLVDEYADHKFKYPFAFPCLVRGFVRLLQDYMKPESSRRLRATFKVGRHLLRFIIQARQQQIAKEVGIGIKNHRPTFARDLQAIFVALEALMRDQAPILVGTKTIAVQNFDSWLPELSNVMSPEEIFAIAIGFVEACSDAKGRLALYKLVLINRLCMESFVAITSTKPIWKANVTRWLHPYWGDAPVVTEFYREQIRLCCSVVAVQINKSDEGASRWLPKLIQSYKVIQNMGTQASAASSTLFPSSYPFPTITRTSEVVCDEALMEITALLATISEFPEFAFPDMSKGGLSVFLLDVLQVYRSILNLEVFPASWLSVNVYYHKASLKALKVILDILILHFLPSPDDAEHFDTELWRAFFLTLLQLVGSECLSLEKFSEQKRRAIWKIGGDVRAIGAELLNRSWEAIGWETNMDELNVYGLSRMGGFQVQYVPALVGPILELCLSIHNGLRCTAVRVLQTMIIGEWILGQDLSVIQAETIERLDQLSRRPQVKDGVLQKDFIPELLSLFEMMAQGSDAQLFQAVQNYVNIVDELLDLLVAVHSADVIGEAVQIMDTLRLMEFLKDMQKTDIYIGYVHELAQVQATAQNYTEAGLALRMHAELYEWDPSTILAPLDVPLMRSQSAFDRKEQIYFQMVRYFEEGMAWHWALNAYSELAAEYQHNIFDFTKLARTERAMATIYERISKGDGQSPRYFRVIYRGLGFPLSLRDKQFIFEGLSSDRLPTFTDKMQKQYPSARVTTSGSLEEIEGQYLTIFPVSPQKDLLHPVNRRSKVSQPIREHFMLARPKQFTMTPRRKGTIMGREHVVEKVLFTTAETFPTILRRSEIIDLKTITLSPVEAALERTIRKTNELRALERRMVQENDGSLTSLTKSLMLLVDKRQNGCVADYWDLVDHVRLRMDREGEEFGITQPLLPYREALMVALTDHVAMIKRCLELYERPALQGTRAEIDRRKSCVVFSLLYLLLTRMLKKSPRPKLRAYHRNHRRRNKRSLDLPNRGNAPFPRLARTPSRHKRSHATKRRTDNPDSAANHSRNDGTYARRRRRPHTSSFDEPGNRLARHAGRGVLQHADAHSDARAVA